MKLTFLGTAAAQSYPNAFCDCVNCERARALGGPSVRKRAAALINDDLLIDLGPDVMTAAWLHDRPLTRVRYCLQTHAHDDHFDPSHLLSRSPDYGVPAAPRLHFYASAGSLRRAALLMAPDVAPASLLDPEVGVLLNLELHSIAAFQSFQVGPYRVTAFPATHDPTVEPLLYAIEAGERAFFYGTDTGVLAEPVWHALHQQGLRFDVVVLDHSLGVDEASSEHLSGTQVAEHVERLRDEGLLAPQGRAFATHIAHDSSPVHPELEEFARLHGYEIPYDGQTV